MSKILVDTAIYIDFLQTGRFHEGLKALYTFRTPDIYFSSIVAEELLQGSLDAEGLQHVEDLYKPFERVGRVAAPTDPDWKEAGKVIARIRREKKGFRTKTGLLLNDTLLATTARRIGAVVYTSNRRDFKLISEFLPFRFQVLPYE